MHVIRVCIKDLLMTTGTSIEFSESGCTIYFEWYAYRLSSATLVLKSRKLFVRFSVKKLLY
ncbi:hypothetical protein EG68_06000 [Paragonimus skrjabini miyazakii]|uniref:Uncharacterized protein n=1 Tax=Paragonimus skrjabini miyazakii TaxID=59628 RepID=A0A8S9Z3K2_9TREM|nr:hypothetical protein EG68_06000 [Paragonimus skrjabini miyazakii]